MRGAAWGVLALLAAASAWAPPAEAKLDQAAQRALAYLQDHAATSGSLAANVAEAAAANGLDPAAWPEGDPVAARVAIPGDDASNVSLLRPLRALALAGDPRAGPGGELTTRVQRLVGPDGYGDPATLNDDAYAILALAAVLPGESQARFQPMRDHLRANQHADGGWGWAVGGAPGTDMTGLAIEALAVAGEAPASLTPGTAGFLQSTRAAGGGFAETPGGRRNCESTVWGIRATLRLGLAVDPDDWDFLLGLQRRDGGFAHVEGGGSDLLCTTEAASLLGEQGPFPEPGGGHQAPAPPAWVAAVLLAATCAVARSTRLREA